ncbi:MAG: hypothetical protein QGG42_08465 [Phycisphaerae bacterium]|nr:hypothetical protein [Phycisphaerae bacterium]
MRSGTYGPASINLMGVETSRRSKTDPRGIWLEAIKPKALRPHNSYEAQLKLRLHRNGADSPKR